MLRDFASEQNRGALAFIIAKIGTVLAVACERGEFGREAARDLGWIGEPQILIGLEPAETVADHDAATHLVGDIGAGAMRGRAQKTDRGARLARCDNRFARVRLRPALRAMAVRIDVRPPLFRSQGSEIGRAWWRE